MVEVTGNQSRAVYLSGWGFAPSTFDDWKLAGENICFSLNDLENYPRGRGGSDENHNCSLWCKGLLEVLRLHQPDMLVAWSMGAIVSLEALIHQLLAQEKSSIRSLVLLSPTPAFVAKDGWPFGQPLSSVRAMKLAIGQSGPRQVLEQFFALCSKGDSLSVCEQARSHIVTLAADKTEAGDKSGSLSGQLSFLERVDLRQAMARFYNSLFPRTLVLHGTEDAVIDIRSSAVFDGGETRYVLAGAGHLLPFNLHARRTVEQWCGSSSEIDVIRPVEVQDVG